MKKITTILMLFIALSINAQIQNFNTKVKFKNVDTVVDAPTYIYAQGDDGLLVKVHKDSIVEPVVAEFVEISESGKTGYSTKFRLDNPEFYGELGNNAIELQRTTASGENGAVGNYSATVGGNGNKSSGTYSAILGGTSNSSSGNYSGILAGNNNTTSGVNSAAIGSFLSVRSYNEIALGRYNDYETPQSTTGWNSADRLYSIGNGNSAGSRSNAFVVRKDGLITFPSLTEQMISDEPTGNVAITRNWFNNNIPIPEPTTWDEITGEQSDINLTGFTDGDFTINTTSFFSRPSGYFQEVAYGSGLYVAVGYGVSDFIYTSPDGINWTAQTPSTGITNLTNITYGNGLFVASGVAGGSSIQIKTSPDGITWTNRTSSTFSYWRDIAYGNGMFVMVAGGNAVADRVQTSPDGITWTNRTFPGELEKLTNVVYGNGMFVAISGGGGSKDVMTSPDGINWTAQNRLSFDTLMDITYGNGLFVIVGLSNELWTSPDGINWTDIPIPDKWWINVEYVGSAFIISDNSSQHMMGYSFDGTNWSFTDWEEYHRPINGINGLYFLSDTSENRLYTTKANFKRFENIVNEYQLNGETIEPVDKVLNIEVPEPFNPIAGTGISITGTYPDMTFAATGGASGTVTSVNSQSPDGSGNVELDSDDIEEGSTNLYLTTSERTLISTAIQADDLADVATSGDYDDLANKPSIPTNNNELTNGAGYITASPLSNYYTSTQVDEIFNGYYTSEDVDDVLTNYVGKTGNETISGTKTFTSSPVVPNGTASGHAVNLRQLNVAYQNGRIIYILDDFTGGIVIPNKNEFDEMLFDICPGTASNYINWDITWWDGDEFRTIKTEYIPNSNTPLTLSVHNGCFSVRGNSARSFTIPVTAKFILYY